MVVYRLCPSWTSVSARKCQVCRILCLGPVVDFVISLNCVGFFGCASLPLYTKEQIVMILAIFPCVKLCSYSSSLFDLLLVGGYLVQRKIDHLDPEVMLFRIDNLYIYIFFIENCGHYFSRLEVILESFKMVQVTVGRYLSVVYFGQFYLFTGFTCKAFQPMMCIFLVCYLLVLVCSYVYRCSFYLHPYEGQTITVLTQGKLSAPRILRIHKVSSLISTNVLTQQQLFVSSESVFDVSNIVESLYLSGLVQ